MTGHQGRHHAARPQDSRRTVGLPRPGQALIGIPDRELTLLGITQPEPSLFEVAPRPAPLGVPRQTSRPDVRPVTVPPRLDVQRGGLELGGAHPRWSVRLGLPLAVLTLTIMLGVIMVVTLAGAMG
jgi:hypothetical protein